MSIATKNTITNRVKVKMINRENNSNNNNSNNYSNSSNRPLQHLQSSSLVNLKANPDFLNNMILISNNNNSNSANNLQKEFIEAQALQVTHSPSPSPIPIVESLASENNNRKMVSGARLENMRKVLVVYTGGTIGMVRLNGEDGMKLTKYSQLASISVL
jgi:hypothetical protein